MSEKDKKKSQLRVADEAIDGKIVQTKVAEIYQRKLSGQQHDEIAEEMGIPLGEVNEVLKRRLGFEAQFLEDNERATILALELARLDKLYQAQWAAAMYGDIRAAQTCLQISDRRMKWSGMDIPDMGSGQHTVLVVGGDEQSYLDKLKGMADG